GLLDPALRGAVQVTGHLSMLDEFVALQHGEKALTVDEVVVHPIHLARAHTPGGVRDRHAHLRHAVDQGLDQAGLAGPGRGGNDVEGTAGGAHVVLVTRYSALVRASVRSAP